ncbi:transposase family protein [Streptomyces cyaneofuscatus]|uniref:transposase family protein n=1 Tax=Streptomyces cyaneofuscatus TaxID=66883 RepID=UPI00378DAC0C
MKLLVDGFATKSTRADQELRVLAYPSAIDLSSGHLRHLAGHLAARRREIGTRWRRITPGRQALLVLAHLRCGGTYAQLAAGFDIGVATVYRYVREAIEVLATLAPSLARVMRTSSRLAFVILDGALRPIDRIAADTPYYSGKHKRHGMNVQALTDPFGRLLWASPALPGSTHDLTTARTQRDRRSSRRCRTQVLGGQGIPRRRLPGPGALDRRRLKQWQRRHNSTHAKIRCVGEQAMAVLKGWRLLRKLRCSTNRITDIVKAVLVLHHAST